MAHTCPDCGKYCTCQGDIDDIDLGEWVGCKHACQDIDDDDLWDDEVDFYDDTDDDDHPLNPPKTNRCP